MQSKRVNLILFLLLVAIGAGGWVYLTRQQTPSARPTLPQAIAKAPALPEPFNAVFLTSKRDDAIQKLRQWLASRPKAEAVHAIRKFLASGKDAPTGQGFKLNRDGSLREAPTLRTLLLDMLGKLDPAQAAAAAKNILQQKSSADEWAVALGLYARINNDPDSLIFVQQKAEEMAGYQPWRQNPSVGYLEAFDVFVYTGDTDFVPELSQFASDKNNPALAHAAFLTLDRLAQNNPVDALGMLEDDPSLLNARQAMQGDLFARADVRDPDQAALLTEYLLAPGRSEPELEAFAGVFPNENFMISANLLTPSAPVVSNAELMSRYQAAEQTVDQWLQDGQFSNVWPQARQIQGRLNRILHP